MEKVQEVQDRVKQRIDAFVAEKGYKAEVAITTVSGFAQGAAAGYYVGDFGRPGRNVGRATASSFAERGRQQQDESSGSP